MIFFHFKHVKRVLPESLERKYFNVRFSIFYKFAFHSCKFCFFVNCVMVFFVFFFFTKCNVLNGTNNYVLGM